MTKKVLPLILAVAFFGCGKKEDAKIAEKAVIEDTIAKPAVGAGEDAHGCKASAGYTWSELSGECIRVFEKAQRLDAYQNADGSKMPAFAIFKDDQAEIFIQTEKPFIAKRRSEGEPFVNGKWELITQNGFVLKNDGKILFLTK